MHRLFYLLISFLCLTSFFSTPGENEIKLLTWNIRDLGKSKSDAEISFIAKNIRNFDLISIQEVVAGYGGAQAVARLVAELNINGKWEYSISDPTNSTSPYISEKYAFIWNTKKVKKIGNSWLEKTYDAEIEREPFFARFAFGTKTITLINFHARPRESQPETEVKYFKFYPSQFPNDILIFASDFNLPENHTVFNPLKKMGFLPAITGNKTSLKKSPDQLGNYLMHQKDNIFYDSNKLTAIDSGVLDFVPQCASLEEANMISDHLGVWLRFR